MTEGLRGQKTAETAPEGPVMVSRKQGFLLGLAGGAVMTFLMVALRFALDTPVLPELISDWLIKVMPPQVFDFFLERLQVSAKPLFFSALLAGQVVAGGGLGVLYARYSPRLPFRDDQPWLRGLAFGGVIWLIIAGVLTPIVEGGFFGAGVAGGAAPYLFAMLLSVLAYAVTLAHLHYMALPKEAGALQTSRRAFVRKAAFFTLLAAGGAFALRSIVTSVSAITPSRVSRNEGVLPPEITPNEDFYEVSKNIVNPRIDATTWSLTISGDGIGNPFSLTYEELKALPAIEEYVTLQCISNPVGGGLISNALWRGVPLQNLLERAQLAPTVERLAFRAADNYVDSFPIAIAMRPQTIVAYLMNGEPLPDSHGFPARIIVPGLWGMENVKWLTKIESVASDFRGYWQVRGWADSAEQNTMSRIDVPAGSEEVLLGADVPVGGVAFAGDRGIRQVEFSTDDGVTWYVAQVQKALSPYAWVLWTGSWTPAVQGIQVMKVRAVDGAGEPQIATVMDSLPDGATGYHIILAQVRTPPEQPSA